MGRPSSFCFFFKSAFNLKKFETQLYMCETTQQYIFSNHHILDVLTSAHNILELLYANTHANNRNSILTCTKDKDQCIKS